MEDKTDSLLGPREPEPLTVTRSSKKRSSPPSYVHLAHSHTAENRAIQVGRATRSDVGDASGWRGGVKRGPAAQDDAQMSLKNVIFRKALDLIVFAEQRRRGDEQFRFSSSPLLSRSLQERGLANLVQWQKTSGPS